MLHQAIIMPFWSIGIFRVRHKGSCVRLPDVDLARFELLRKSHETKIPSLAFSTLYGRAILLHFAPVHWNLCSCFFKTWRHVQLDFCYICVFHTTPTLPRHLVSKHFHHSSLSSASFVCGTVHGFQIFTSLQNVQERTKALLGMLESFVVYI